MVRQADESKAKPFELGREVVADGRFVRQASVFRRWVSADGSSGWPSAAGRYHLYVCLACPWSHRTVIVRHVKGLEEAISMSLLDPYRDGRGWAFSGGEFTDPVNGFAFLREAYEASDPVFGGRVTVPVLWDRETRQIVSNESADIVRMFNGEFEGFAQHHVDLYPQPLRAEIDAVNEFVYENVNDGVYRAGFARSQAAYERAYERLFAALDRLEERLAVESLPRGRLAHRGRLAPLPDAGALRRRLLRPLQVQPPPADRLSQPVGLHARPLPATGYRADRGHGPDQASLLHDHGFLNPSSIIPAGPEIDFEAPHDRERLSGQGVSSRCGFVTPAVRRACRCVRPLRPRADDTPLLDGILQCDSPLLGGRARRRMGDDQDPG